MLCLPNNGESLDVCYLWGCWLRKVCTAFPAISIRDMSPSHLSQVNHFSLLNTYGRYKEGHARRHWEETEHCYSLELETQRVWDYAGDNYVHRLIQSKTDGKLVELNSYGSLSKDGCGSCEYSDSGMTDALLNSKVDMVVLQFHIFIILVFNFCVDLITFVKFQQHS